jgi:hypothetical protein
MEDRTKQEKEEVLFQICFIHRNFVKKTKDVKEVMEAKDINRGSIYCGPKGYEKAGTEASRLNEAYPGWKYFIEEISA